jgi:hypothetical protein
MVSAPFGLVNAERPLFSCEPATRHLACDASLIKKRAPPTTNKTKTLILIMFPLRVGD